MTGADLSVNQASVGIATVAAIEPSDTYRQIHTVSTNSVAEIAVASGASIQNTPHAVATPLPPWKRNHTGYMCPRIAATPAATGSAAPAAKRAVNSTLLAPFATSTNTTRTATARPAVR